MVIGFRICQQFLRTEYKYTITRTCPNPSLFVFNQYAYAFLRIVFIEEMTEFIAALSIGFGKVQPTAKGTDPHPPFTIAQHTKYLIGCKRIHIINPISVLFISRIQSITPTSQPKDTCGIFTKRVYIFAIDSFVL